MKAQRTVLQVSKSLAQEIIGYVTSLLNIPAAPPQIGGSTTPHMQGMIFADHDLGVIVLWNAAIQNVTYTSNAFLNYPGQDTVTIEIQYLVIEPASLTTNQAPPSIIIRGRTATIVKSNQT